tara:strand:+ start:877 stop:2013 length:1137 start_codon:yes stop_codon:yes gene_type:complete
MKPIIIITIIFYCLISCKNTTEYGKEVDTKKAIELDSLFKEHHKVGKFNGNILVAENGKIIYENSFGYSNEENKIPLNLKSIFDLASISKQFTATGIVILNEKEKLSYNDNISKYIPELNHYKGIKIKNLLNHTSGLPDYEEVFKEYWDKSKIATNADLISLFEKVEPKTYFTAGKKFEYSNTGYVLLATIIERVSGLTYSEFMSKEIFQPLEMENTFIFHRFLQPRTIENLAHGYFYSDSLKQKIPVINSKSDDEVVYLDGMVGDGAINCTIGDLFIWDRAIRNNKIISQKSKELMFLNSKTLNNESTNYGFGWMLEENPDIGKIVLHTGDWAGFINYFERAINKNNTIILLQNEKLPTTRIPRNGIREILYKEQAN